MQFFFNRRRTRPRVFFGRERIEVSLFVDPDRWHLANRRIESAGLTPRRILRIIDALSGERHTRGDKTKSRKTDEKRFPECHIVNSHSPSAISLRRPEILFLHWRRTHLRQPSTVSNPISIWY